MGKSARPRGQTQASGWEIGARRTVPVPAGQMWALLVSVEGLRCWLGDVPELRVAPRVAYQLADGTSGEFTVVKPGSHLRLTWRPVDWPRHSIMQVRVIPQAERAVVALHQEQLPDASAREQRRAAFTAALEGLYRLGVTGNATLPDRRE
jgi:uncharacterized protein YndB with AHSA1/START domain